MTIAKIILLVLLCLNIQITIPMEKQLWHNASQPGVCDLFMNASMPSEQPLNLIGNGRCRVLELLQNRPEFCNKLDSMRDIFMLIGTVALGVIKSYLEKQEKRIHLFEEKTDAQPVKTFAAVSLCLGTGYLIESARHGCTICGSFWPGTGWTEKLYILGQFGIWSCYVCLRALKQAHIDNQQQLIIKEKLDINTLSDANCLICYDDEVKNEYLNPCEQKDHIFCKGCFINYLTRKKITNNANFWCDWCRKQVTCDDTKFKLPSAQPKVTWKLWKEQITRWDLLVYVWTIALFGALAY